MCTSARWTIKNRNPSACSRPTSGMPNIALGGVDCTTYDIKPVSLLVHWNKSKSESEVEAYKLFEKLKSVTSLSIGDTHINYLRLISRNRRTLVRMIAGCTNM